MKRIIFLTIILAFFIGGIPAISAAESPKIGVINFEKIMRESSAGKMNQKTLNDRGQELKEKLEKEKQALDELGRSFEKEALVLSDEKKRDRERDFRNQVEDFRIKQQEYANEMKNLEIKMVNDMQKAVFDLANELGKKENYLMILERKNAGVIYIPDQVDITDLIIQKYNAITAKGS
ncbi:MAG TPA: OmpH family outer membrane protein [Desulfotignum sp.]|nr:OmpH family outer membrane protein [Desulfotignum sp.]